MYFNKIAWMTDLHLDCLESNIADLFIDTIVSLNPDCAIICGDTAESDKSLLFLDKIASSLNKPVFFVLGNHDFWYSSTSVMRGKALDASIANSNLRYLQGGWGINRDVPDGYYTPGTMGFALDDSTILIGHDGWADHRIGALNSRIILGDFHYIKDLAFLPNKTRIAIQRKLADECAAFISLAVKSAVENGYKNIIFATHIPTFRESCVYNGKISDPEFLPHFSNKAAGDAIIASSKDYPECNFIVLAGHTHGKTKVKIRPKIICYTGAFDQTKDPSDYRKPVINIFELKDLND